MREGRRGQETGNRLRSQKKTERAKQSVNTAPDVIMPRRFNLKQRRALYLIADGQCEICGEALTEGWHADHVVPYSKGGATIIDNGQALCPSCNLNKSNSLMANSDPYQSDVFGPTPYSSPHKWQRRAIEKFFSTDEYFLADATPGAGKTALAAYLFRRGYKAEWEQIIVVTNSQDRREGWVKDLHSFGINLMENWSGRDRQPTLKNYHGSVITYNIMPGNEMDLKALTKRPSLVVFDEIHHLGDSLTWGHAAKEAFDRPSVQTIGLTGTPFRSDAHRIPFVEYEPDDEGNLKSKGHVGYSYGDALRDGVLRYINFKTYDGEMEWHDSDGELYEASFDDEIPEHAMGGRLRTAILTKQWVMPALRNANRKLNAIRKHTPNAGGLVVAKDQSHALKIQSWMEADDQFNSPVVVVSDDSEAQSALNDFRESKRRWVIAVRMISEGVNIKRLRVGFYASNVVAPLFLNQVIGRVLRGPDGQSWFWFPKDPRIVPVLDEIKEMRNHVIEEREMRESGDREENDSPSLFMPIDAQLGAAEILGPLLDEIPSMDQDDLEQLPPEVLAAYIRSQLGQQRGPVQNGEPLHEQEQRLRSQLNRLAAAVAARWFSVPYKKGGRERGKAIAKVHGKANSRIGISDTDTATVKDLQRKKQTLLNMMKEA